MKYKNVGVIGAGRSGLAAAKFLRRKGAHVLLSDAGKIKALLPRGIEKEEGGHSERLLEMDLLVRSPGVPDHLAILEKARRKNIPILAELELASRFIHPKTFVAITGTNGKTTTTTLVGELFKAAGRATLVGGNIGTPLAELAPKVNSRSTVVLEVSSYQLENIETFHANIAAILNVTPDHLEHHGTMAAYAAAKARIFENQTRRDITVLNADNVWCKRLANRCPGRVFWFSRRRVLSQGVYFQNGSVVIRWGKLRASWVLKSNLPGPHNIENLLASIAIALAGGLSFSVIRKVLEQFKGVEHRLETVRRLDGVLYVNDSKGTNVDSTRVALQSFSQPLVVIMGGQGKKSPYAPLRPLIKKKVKKILLIGEDAPQIRKELGDLVAHDICGKMDRAVKRARQVATEGDVVLLSPACASFDQYKNYEERGRHFKTLVRQLS